MYQNCISSKPIGSVWKIKHDHSDNCLATWSTWKYCAWTGVCLGFLLNRKVVSARAKDQSSWDYSDTSGAQTCAIKQP